LTVVDNSFLFGAARYLAPCLTMLAEA